MKITRIVTIIVMLIAAAAGGWFAASSRSHNSEHGEEQAHVAESKATDHDDHDDHDEEEAEEDGHEGHGHGKKPAAGEYCPEHRMLEAVDALCNPDLIIPLLPGQGVLVRLGTPEAAARAGVATVLPQKVASATGPIFPSQTIYSRNGLAQVAALTSGVVQRLYVDVGTAVVKGQILAEIASTEVSSSRAELATAQSRLNLAETALRREEQLFAKGISARQELEQIRAEQEASIATLEQARQRLALYGAAAQGSGATITLRSPLTGIVAERSVVAGQSILPETPLFTVVNLARMGIELSLPADRIALAKVGAPIEALFDGMEGERFTGKIVQIAPALDSQTRLLKVLAEVENPQQLLKSGLFGQVRLLGAVAGEALEIPGNAVQMIDGKPFVFIERESDLFELRRVATGPRRGKFILVEAGLHDDEKVVATQGFALKSEVLKSRLGASCADH
ncbi:MAG: efflux RND transporter periplasmic adaptor subunit [Desulfuromonadales bacterium]|nr:efflux RND transporter periplasmic adaptor subunit [Desulfuromonadales bacterium]